MKIRVQKKQPIVWAVEVKGRHLAHTACACQFDNIDEIREICEWNFISWNDVVVDEKMGLITIPSVGVITIGCYLVESTDTGLEVYDSIEGLQNFYNIVE